ncbi:hypothetical protein BPUTEOMOX_1313 [methanotrophic endosymbiont of Bathymodiolus puteoserpentis (Logatchev)]|nr:hypothetical protein BPUTEOMOX_1313 [methanotrophic endosymbiont of Bathymodiolus puteoserpentis (Logatchev)]
MPKLFHAHSLLSLPQFKEELLESEQNASKGEIVSFADVFGEVQ